MLLVVLLLLATAAVAMVAACRATVRRSVMATEALADLQHRWGSVTAQYTLLSDAGNVIDRVEGNGRTITAAHGAFQLGSVQFDVDLCDEQARANVNALLAWRGRASAETLVRDLARAGGSRLAPRLPEVGRPTSTADDEPSLGDRVSPVVGCLTEVFPSARWDDLRPGPGSASAELTCYGNGRVNVRRASLAVLSAALGPTVKPDQIERLARICRSAPTVDPASVMSQVGASPDDVLKLSGRLTDGSDAQSIWMVAHDGRRTWRTWAVRDGSDAEHPRTFTGDW